MLCHAAAVLDAAYCWWLGTIMGFSMQKAGVVVTPTAAAGWRLVGVVSVVGGERMKLSS